ncbi:MAG TPA: mycofactocin biosynthesis glycosyltransferase MftF [Acidimicrobiales bacterium]
MGSPIRDDIFTSTMIRRAPDRATTPLPATFTLSMDPATVTFGDGNVLMGGSPLRLLRLSRRARALATSWSTGVMVGARRPEQVLARRLVSTGIFAPRPTVSAFGPPDVTVVIPVRDRPAQLHRLLTSLDGLSCVVVDDASSDVEGCEQIAHAGGARFIALETNQGPSAARNAGLACVSTPLVAFVDSDCEPAAGWLSSLLGYFDDPLVGAVAPRIVPAEVSPPTWLSRYEAVRSSLDRGGSDGLVRPMSRIPYVPSATIVVRRAVADDALFDPRLRGGEDVDLVWRLVDAGWDVRYVPSVTVAHQGPLSVGSWLSRRSFYGTTAGPLSERHPSSMAPLHTSAWTAGVWWFILTRRPVLAGATLAASILVLARRLTALVDQPVRMAATIAGGGTAKSALPALSGLTRAWSPLMALGLCSRRTRRSAALALLGPAINDWVARPGDLDPVRYATLHVADDLAYGAGVWLGCLRSRTLRPLIPKISLRARVWSPRSLRTQLSAADRGHSPTRGEA